MDDKQYHKQYYQNNKDRLKKYRKGRYDLDPEYRQKIKSASKLRSRMATLSINNDFLIWEVESEMEFVYTLNQMRLMLPRSYHSLRYLSHMECIPFSTVRSTQRVDYYTESQVRLLHYIFTEYEGITCSNMRRLLLEFWDRKFNKKEVGNYAKRNIPKDARNKKG